MAGKVSWLGLGLVVLATLCWSTGGLFITVIFRGSSIMPLGLAFWRVLVTGICLVAGILLLRPALIRVRRADLPWLVAAGVLSVGVFQVLWIQAVLMNGVSVATVIQCNAPVMVTLLAWLFWREPLTWQKWAAIGMAFLGTLLVSGLSSLGGAGITSAGLLVSLGSALAYAGITLFTKKLTGSYAPWTILLYLFLFGALALFPLQFGRPLPLTPDMRAVAAFVGLVFLTTIGGYAAYAGGLRHLPASTASIVAMSEVPFAAFIGAVFLGERMDSLQIVGAAVVVSGVILLSTQEARLPGRRRVLAQEELRDSAPEAASGSPTVEPTVLE